MILPQEFADAKDERNAHSPGVPVLKPAPVEPGSRHGTAGMKRKMREWFEQFAENEKNGAMADAFRAGQDCTIGAK